MTEEEWLACADPTPMLEAVGSRASHRKSWLFGCACCRRIWSLLSPASRCALELSEQYADGLVGHAELMDACLRNYQGAEVVGGELVVQCAVATNLAVVDPARNGIPSLSVVQAASLTATKVLHILRLAEDIARSAGNGQQSLDVGQEQVIQAGMLRDVFCNPFRLHSIDPVFRTSTVVGIAQEIYEDRAFDRLPALADTLQDAGCENEDILNHCRSDGQHVRGCWVVDLILGKQ